MTTSHQRSRFMEAFYPWAWSRRTRRHFLRNILVGIAITGLMVPLEHSRPGRLLLNSVMDALIEHESRSTNAPLPRDMVFVDITEECDTEWSRGEGTIARSVTPRDKIATLIQEIGQFQPRLILLDIDLSLASCDARQDDSLRHVLSRLRRTGSRTRFVFPAEISGDDTRESNILNEFVREDSLSMFASPGVATEAQDRTIRYTVLFTVARGETLWSLPIAAIGLSRGLHKSDFSLPTLERMLRLDLLEAAHANPSRIDIYASRIRYFLVPPASDGSYRMDANTDGFGDIDLTKTARELEILERDPNPASDLRDSFRGYFRDKIVLIGNSAPSKGDLHLTPIGEISGLYIVGNAVNTLANGYQVTRLAWPLALLLEAAAILILAYLFMQFRSAPGTLIGTVILGILFYFPTTWFFLEKGVFINSIFVLFGISIHGFVSGFERASPEQEKNAPDTHQMNQG